MEPKRDNKRKFPTNLSETGRLQPQAIELEEAVLGALMLEKDAYMQVCEIIKPEYFYVHNHQLIYEAIQSLSLKQKPVDILTVQEELKKEGRLDEIGGSYYLAQLTGNVVSTAHLEYHAQIVAQKYVSRELIRLSSDVQGKAYDDSVDVADLMQEAEARLFDLNQNTMKNEVVQINDIVSQAIRKIEDAAKNESGMTGVPSGFHDLDKLTFGWQDTDLIIIAARPAMGKTAFALSMIRNIGVDQKCPVGFFSLEMSNIQLVNRLIVNVCEIEAEKIKSGKLEQHEWIQLSQEVEKLYDAPIFIDDTAGLSIFDFASKARRLVREHHVKLIIIDYLQLMTAGGKFGTREQEVSTISRSLKGLAKELNIPIIALSQVNRASTTRSAQGNTSANDAKRPQLSDLRESGAIEQDADLVCFIHRPEYYHIYEDESGNSLRGMAEIIVAKHRNGATDDVRLRFRNTFAKFSNIDDEESYPMDYVVSSKANVHHENPVSEFPDEDDERPF